MKKKGGRPRIPVDVVNQILSDRKKGVPFTRISKKYHVAKATIQRIEEREKKKEPVKHMTAPTGAQYRISYTWYKVKGNMVFWWWEQFQEWISTRGITPSELARDGERVG
jgi:hypothetical protein